MSGINEITKTPVAGYISQYNDAIKSFLPGMSEIKGNAIKRFEELGFPTRKNEEWKYTDVSGLFKNNFIPGGKELKLTAADIKSFLPVDDKQIVLVFENGVFNKGLSQISELPKGLIAGDLQSNFNHASVKKHLGKIAVDNNESFIALNTALFHQGAFVYADKNFNSEFIIQLLFINDARLNPSVCYPRNLYVAEQSASLKISENYYSVNAVNPAFCNSVSEVFIGENASMEICKNEAESKNDFHIDYTGIFQRINSKLLINTITSGGGMVRNNLRIELQERNCSAYLNGLSVISGESYVDNHSFVDHASPDCYSNELYKGVLDEKARGVFNGKIFVRKDAQKTNAYQSNKSMLLSDDATMNSKPQLEIYADDVKCSHGATTGQLDPEAMFYFRSRGIGETTARALLTNAFAEEILDKITITQTREMLKSLIHHKLTKAEN